MDPAFAAYGYPLMAGLANSSNVGGIENASSLVNNENGVVSESNSSHLFEGHQQHHSQGGGPQQSSNIHHENMGQQQQQSNSQSIGSIHHHLSTTGIQHNHNNHGLGHEQSDNNNGNNNNTNGGTSTSVQIPQGMKYTLVEINFIHILIIVFIFYHHKCVYLEFNIYMQLLFYYFVLRTPI